MIDCQRRRSSLIIRSSCSLNSSSLTYVTEVSNKGGNNLVEWLSLRLRKRKDFKCLLVSELELSSLSAASVEDLPPAPLVGILEPGTRSASVGHPCHPLVKFDATGHANVSALLSICHVVGELLISQIILDLLLLVSLVGRLLNLVCRVCRFLNLESRLLNLETRLLNLGTRLVHLVQCRNQHLELG